MVSLRPGDGRTICDGVKLIKSSKIVVCTQLCMLILCWDIDDPWLIHIMMYCIDFICFIYFFGSCYSLIWNGVVVLCLFIFGLSYSLFGIFATALSSGGTSLWTGEIVHFVVFARGLVCKGEPGTYSSSLHQRHKSDWLFVTIFDIHVLFYRLFWNSW